jgi:hypothetical protein
MKIKIGDRVRTIPKTNNSRACDAVVVDVVEHDPDNPIEDHGCVEVRFENKRPFIWTQELEQYTHSNWQAYLRIIEKD